MICKKIPNPKKSATKAARATGLAEYITEPELTNKIEKCIFSEAVNFLTNDLRSQTLEMISLAQEAVKSKDPIDHWVLSWKSNEKPTPEHAREAAVIFIKQCGLTGHQYITGLHDDTDNLHLHIAVNRVNSETYKVVKINNGFDKESGHQAIAIIEKMQGWSVEEHARYRTNDKAELIIDSSTHRPQIFADGEKKQKPTTKAQAMEVQTGEKSAQRIGIESAAPIIASATSWRDLHEKLTSAGMQYQRKGSGATVQVGDELVKASDVSRAASLSALQKRFGPYQPPTEINQNDYFNASRNFTNAKEPHAFEIGQDAGHGLRNLSECTLAHSEKGKQTSRARVLQLDARADRRGVDGLRWDTRRAAGDPRTSRSDSEGLRSTASYGREETSNHAIIFRQPLKPNQLGWKEYIAIRDVQKAAKNFETIDLQKRHGDERAALAVKQKAERADVFLGNWKGKGDAKNALQSIIATQQAAEKLELSEQHREERKELQAKYKPLPMYKQWKEQPLIVSEHVRPLIDQHIERDRQPPKLSQIIRLLTNSVDARHHVTYQLNRRDVFRDEGRTIKVLDLKSEAGIAAALATAQQKFGNVLTLTGSLEFQKNAVAIAVANNLTCKFADPAMDALRARLQATKYQAERAAAAQLEKSMVKAMETPAAVPSQPNPTRAAVPPVPAPEAQQQPNVEEPAVDYLADIHQQIAAAKAAADPRSLLALSTTTEADHEAPANGVIVASNEAYVAVKERDKVKLYSTIELAKLLSYVGIDTGHGRFAPGNQIERKNGKDGMRTLLTEEREHMQPEAKRERDTGHGL